MKKLVLTTIAFVIALMANAADCDFVYETYGNVKLYCKITKAATSTSSTGRGAVTIVGGTGPEGSEVYISLVSYNGYDYRPTAIAAEAFKDAEWISILHLGSYDKSVGDYAFRGCTNLTKLYIHQNSILGMGEFYGCSSLESVDIPQTITTIPDRCFCNCYKLSTLTIGRDVTTIGDYAFYGTNLTKVTIPSSVTSLGKQIFAQDFLSTKGLKYININSNALVSQDYTFENNLTDRFGIEGRSVNIVFSEGITTIGKYAFADDYETGPRDVREWDAYYKTKVHVTFPSTLKEIHYGAFNHSRIVVLELPEGLQTIGSIAFANCYILASVTIPSTLSSVNYVAFNADEDIHVIHANAANPDAYHGLVNGNYDRKLATVYVKDMNVYNSIESIKDKLGNFVLLNGTDPTIKEDVNEDGQVNSLDVLKVYKYMQSH